MHLPYAKSKWLHVPHINVTTIIALTYEDCVKIPNYEV